MNLSGVSRRFWMHSVLKTLAAVIGGSAAGLALTWASVFLTHFGTVRNGPWETSLAVGSAQSGPYLRAYVAVHGLLALNRSETIYYNAIARQRRRTLARQLRLHRLGP